MPAWQDKTVPAIGRGSGIASAIALAAANTTRITCTVPGTIYSGAYDVLREQRKTALFNARSATSPAGRGGPVADIAPAAPMVLANGFLAGTSQPTRHPWIGRRRPARARMPSGRWPSVPDCTLSRNQTHDRPGSVNYPDQQRMAKADG
jgi:hypothetical protein